MLEIDAGRRCCKRVQDWVEKKRCKIRLLAVGEDKGRAGRRYREKLLASTKLWFSVLAEGAGRGCW